MPATARPSKSPARRRNNRVDPSFDGAAQAAQAAEASAATATGAAATATGAAAAAAAEPPPTPLDGTTRAMTAMMVLTTAKAEYDALPAGDEAAAHALHRKHAQACFETARASGGVYIKAAQFVASLKGAAEAGIPAEYVSALASLTDQAPGRPWAEVVGVVDEDLPGSSSDAFVRIEPLPLAAASLAQVHRATLREEYDGISKVAIKVQRPGLAAQMADDFGVFAAFRSMVRPGGHDLGWLVDDVQRHIGTELDFRNEVRNAAACRAALAWRQGRVRVPAVVPKLCSARVVTSELIEGCVRVDDAEGLRRIGVRPAEAAELIASAFAELTLVHGLVHGDPHAGNVYLRAAAAAAPGAGATRWAFWRRRATAELVIFDHGLYHTLDDAARRKLAELLLLCARPRPPKRRVRQAAEALAGPQLWKLLPLLLSPSFALGSSLTRGELRAAARGELPADADLDAVWRALVAVREREPWLLGLLHSLGYVRGLLGALGQPERARVHALARWAAVASASVVSPVPPWWRAPRLAVALVLTWVRVALLFGLLRVVGAVLGRKK